MLAVWHIQLFLLNIQLFHRAEAKEEEGLASAEAEVWFQALCV